MRKDDHGDDKDEEAEAEDILKKIEDKASIRGKGGASFPMNPKSKAKAKAKAKATSTAGAQAKAKATVQTKAKSKSTTKAKSKSKAHSSKASAALKLGCSKCRGSRSGCMQCQNPDFGGKRWQR